jgi:hypothetical protein
MLQRGGRYALRIAAPSDERTAGFGIRNLSVSRESALRWASMIPARTGVWCAKPRTHLMSSFRLCYCLRDFCAALGLFRHTKNDGIIFVCVAFFQVRKRLRAACSGSLQRLEVVRREKASAGALTADMC